MRSVFDTRFHRESLWRLFSTNEIKSGEGELVNKLYQMGLYPLNDKENYNRFTKLS